MATVAAGTESTPAVLSILKCCFEHAPLCLMWQKSISAAG